MNRPTSLPSLRGAACFFVLSLVAGCDSSVSLEKCPLPDTPKAPAQSSHPSKEKKAETPLAKHVNADLPKNVRIYLDGSGSMKGFLAPGTKSDPALFKLARMRQTVVSLRDALAPQGVTQKISHFMVFEDRDIRQVRSDDQWRTLTGSDCLITEPNENGNAKTRKAKKHVNPGCWFEAREAYSGQSLSHKEIILDFLKSHSGSTSAPPSTASTASEDQADMAVIISDLYSFNKTAPGDASEILDPLRMAMDKGLSIALVSVWSGFDGHIVDLPPWVKQELGDTYRERYKGRLPLHLLMIGKAPALRSVLARLQDRLTSGSR